MHAPSLYVAPIIAISSYVQTQTIVANGLWNPSAKLYQKLVQAGHFDPAAGLTSSNFLPML
jgi:hypothetical protein